MADLENTIKTTNSDFWYRCNWYRVNNVKTISEVPNIPSNQKGIIYEHLEGGHPCLKCLEEDWLIYYDNNSIFDNGHIEIKTLNKERAFEIIQNQRLNIMKYLGAVVSEELELKDIKDFF